ncbi:hypothetical protein EPN42_01505 [bacterium]|nr:MAG: hypothetical protein EPN42_01505 [bacterium]
MRVPRLREQANYDLLTSRASFGIQRREVDGNRYCSCVDRKRIELIVATREGACGFTIIRLQHVVLEGWQVRAVECLTTCCQKTLKVARAINRGP